MRVISGIAKGHKLKAPAGLNTRPTEDRLKEAFFNILGHVSPEDEILDLFAGSGSIGIEFLSRGAKTAYFVDQSKEAVEIIKRNLQHTKLLEKAKVFKGDAKRKLYDFSRKGQSFSIIYLDPPFDKGQMIIEIIELLEQLSLLKGDGIIVLEHDSKIQFEDKICNFEKIKSKKYGRKSLTFFKEGND